jgi:cell division protein FtsB
MTQFNYWFGDYNRSDLNSMKEEIAQISIENEELLFENKLLEEEKDKLSSGREAM